MKIILNITNKDGILLGQVTTTKAEIRSAQTDPIGARALVEDIGTQVGV